MGETFRGKMDRCRESQGWTTAWSSSSMPEHDRKDQGQDIPKQACSGWFARHCSLATSGTNLYPPGVWFAGVTQEEGHTGFLHLPSAVLVLCHVFLWCYVCFVFCFSFRLYAFIKAAAFRSIVLRYACAPTATRKLPNNCLRPFLFWFLRRRLSFRLCMESTSYVCSFRMMFSTL